MLSPSAHDATPNVVPPEAAARIRSLVFEARGQSMIVPLEIVAKLVAEGHGAEFDEKYRPSRVLTWVKQVLRRLRKFGWLLSGTSAEWAPTAALRACPDAARLAGKPPRRRPPPASPPPPVAPAEAKRPPAPPLPRREPPPRAEAPPPPRRPAESQAEQAPPDKAPPPRPAEHPAPVRVLPMEAPPHRPSRSVDFDAVLASIREKHAAALREAEFYGQFLKELEQIAGSTAPRSGTEEAEAAPPAPKAKAPREKGKRTVVKTEVSAPDAIVLLLADVPRGLKGREIIEAVAKAHGYKPNSLRTTLYNLKKSGRITQDAAGNYRRT